jgi:hypothetical protein
MRPTHAAHVLWTALTLIAGLPLGAAAQSTTLRVIGSDNAPVPYAMVTVHGGTANITSENGDLILGSGKHKTYDLEVRRIGYQPWSGKIESADTAAVVVVTLPTTGAANTSAVPSKSQLALNGFYDRWLQKQKGMYRDATFIGPEMIEQRHPAATMDLLDHVFGVTLAIDSKGARAATGTGVRPAANTSVQNSRGGAAFGRARAGGGFIGSGGPSDPNVCYMTVLLDGGPVCPNVGCHYTFVADPPGSSVDDHSLDLDKLIDVKNVAGIEVYPRHDGMPVDVEKEYNGCGVIVIWTGSRAKTP